MSEHVHVCLSGSLACSGLVPCEACLKEHELRVLPRLARAAGFNGSIEQWRAVLEGHRQGWGVMRQALYEDPTLRARMHVRDVSEAQRTAPVVPIDAPPQAPPPQPPAWGGSSPWGASPSHAPQPWGTAPGYPPPGYAASPPQAPASPSAAEAPSAAEPPQVIGQVVHGQPGDPGIRSSADPHESGRPDQRTPGPSAGLGYDPLSPQLSPEHLSDIMSRARQTGPARVKVRSSKAPPQPAVVDVAPASVQPGAGGRKPDLPPVTEDDVLQAVVPIDPATPGSTNGAPPR